MEQQNESPDESAPVNLTPGDNAPFTPELMARFCDVLSETGRVTAACRAVGKHRDTIYAHRRTNPLFAMALESARADARQRLADGLLEEALEGSIEYFYRNGELVGERHYRDNRLALALLRRLDRMADEQPRPARARSPAFDSRLALKALRTGTEEDLCAALAMLDSDTSDNPPFSPDEDADVPDPEFGTDRVWRDEGEWWTNFPPPGDFDGAEHGHWSDGDYERQCTAEECELLDAAREASRADYRAEEEADRDSFFGDLRAELGTIPLPAREGPGVGASGSEDGLERRVPAQARDDGMAASAIGSS